MNFSKQSGCFQSKKLTIADFMMWLSLIILIKPIGLECLLVFLRVLIITVKVYALPEEFIKFFYQCLDEYDEDNFLEKWNQLKINYPSADKYLRKMDKILTRWAPCYNRHLFMADMTTTQRGESMNSLMKGYMDATTSL